MHASCKELFQNFVLRKNDRPLVLAPTRTKMPEQVKPNAQVPEYHKEEQGRLYCVYMRPWTLLHALATPHVPHVTDLHYPIPRRRCPMKRSFGYAAVWKSYIRGNVVSEHQKGIIKSFMAQNRGRSRNSEEKDDGTHQKHKYDPATFNNACSVNSVHEVLTAMSNKAAVVGTAIPKGDKKERQDSTEAALQLSQRLWGPDTKKWPTEETLHACMYGPGDHTTTTHQTKAKPPPKKISAKLKANVFLQS